MFVEMFDSRHACNDTPLMSFLGHEARTYQREVWQKNGDEKQTGEYNLHTCTEEIERQRERERDRRSRTLIPMQLLLPCKSKKFGWHILHLHQKQIRC